MFLIEGITNDAKQIQTLILPNGKECTLSLEFKPMQTGWFLSLTYLDFSVSKLRVVTTPNLLHQFKNLVPFGIGCFVAENQEALLQEDFKSGRAQLFILDSSDVDDFEAVLSGQVSA